MRCFWQSLASCLRRWAVVTLALLAVVFAVARPAPVAAAALRAPVHPIMMVTGSILRGPSESSMPGASAPLDSMLSNPFALCTNDQAYIIGFHLPGGRFVEGMQANWVDAADAQLLYLWCPTWLTTFFPGGVNFAEVQIRNTTNICQVYSIGKPEPDRYLSPGAILNAYTGASLINSAGTQMATASIGQTTRTLCPGQNMTLFSNAADGRYCYYAMALFYVNEPSCACGWGDVLLTPYPR